jgi:glyoxylase-like metal-dependent hydrolase (beta-lactamase superfamily II)
MRILEDVYLVGSGQMGISHPFDCHVYLIDGGDELALVDSGAGVEVRLILSNVRADGLERGKIRKVLLTHHHADHSGGCSRLRERLEVVSCLHKNGVAFVERGDEDEMGLTVAKRSGLYSPDYVYRPFQVNHPLEDGEAVSVGRYTLEAYHVPGHSPDATCYLMDTGDGAVLFTGDVVFFGGRVGLLNRSGSNLEDYRKSLPRLVPLAFESLLPGHGVFVLRGGKRHVEMADEALRKVQPPPNFI